ncbi:hypothetical protein AB0J80_06820 [Actinoplanes sp. NPDC049548]|uniref:hypothetical protein n=1 Tax=Actinoplanes sp. NPDC049548 TaxID=3155152 RepID=UPI0034498A8A
MTNHERSELLKKVERYENAFTELKAAHDDVKDVLIETILFDRWQQLGTQLGFKAQQPAANGKDKGKDDEPNRDLAQLNQQISAMSESWSH